MEFIGGVFLTLLGIVGAFEYQRWRERPRTPPAKPGRPRTGRVRPQYRGGFTQSSRPRQPEWDFRRVGAVVGVVFGLVVGLALWWLGDEAYLVLVYAFVGAMNGVFSGWLYETYRH